ncbi:MAG: hypothetical protein ACTSQE_06735 [Candidatus Heimdallarchaeaceae archaeon]
MKKEILEKYIKYVEEYPDDHEVEGNYPVCFDEWYNNDYQEEENKCIYNHDHKAEPDKCEFHN